MIRQANMFEASIGEIATIIDPAITSIDQLSTAVQQQAIAFGQDQTTQARALYGIISAGATDASEAIELLNESNQLAQGGVTDVATASASISGILNAYSLSASDARDVSDSLFTVVRLGTTTMAELGHSICLLYTSPSPRDRTRSRMPSSA